MRDELIASGSASINLGVIPEIGETSGEPLVPGLDEERARARIFAGEMAREFLELVESYCDSAHVSLSLQDAEKWAKPTNGPDLETDLSHSDFTDIGWDNLSRLFQRDPQAAQALWERLVARKRDELVSGTQAARVFEQFYSQPDERAEFLVLRDAFRNDWKPRGAIEERLVDALAQAWHAYEWWSGKHHAHARYETKYQPESTLAVEGPIGPRQMARIQPKYRRRELQRQVAWEPPTLDRAALIEQSAAMAERFHRMFLRTLRALRDLRRVPVTVGSVGQLNVGEKQVNVTVAVPSSRVRKVESDTVVPANRSGADDAE